MLDLGKYHFKKAECKAMADNLKSLLYDCREVIGYANQMGNSNCAKDTVKNVKRLKMQLNILAQSVESLGNEMYNAASEVNAEELAEQQARLRMLLGQEKPDAVAISSTISQIRRLQQSLRGEN